MTNGPCFGASRERERGFTLIEVMITVAIVAILASLALPSYRDYVLRGYLAEATNELSAMRARMEQYYQDNRTYKAGGLKWPCADDQLPTLKTFSFRCNVVDKTTYELIATGKGAAAGFEYSIDGTPAKQSTVSSAWGGGSYTCWITRRGETC